MTDLLHIIHNYTGQYTYLFALLTGFIFAAPFGVVTVLALKQRNHYGFWAGLKVALFCILGDGIAGFGVFNFYHQVQNLLNDHQQQLSLSLGFIVILLAIIMIKTHDSTPPKAGIRLYAFVVLITVLNPGNLLAFLSYNILAAPKSSVVPLYPNLTFILIGALITWLLVMRYVPKKEYINKVQTKSFPLGGVIILVLGISLLASGIFA